MSQCPAKRSNLQTAICSELNSSCIMNGSCIACVSSCYHHEGAASVSFPAPYQHACPCVSDVCHRCCNNQETNLASPVCPCHVDWFPARRKSNIVRCRSRKNRGGTIPNLLKTVFLMPIFILGCSICDHSANPGHHSPLRDHPDYIPVPCDLQDNPTRLFPDSA